MKWTDSREIAIELAEKFPEVDPKTVNFVDLYKWVLALEGFSQREIAGSLGLEENTVTQRLSRARRQLAQWLGGTA